MGADAMSPTAEMTPYISAAVGAADPVLVAEVRSMLAAAPGVTQRSVRAWTRIPPGAARRSSLTSTRASEMDGAP